MPPSSERAWLQREKILFKKAVGRYWIPFLVLGAYLAFAFFLTDSFCVFRVFTGLPCPGCGLTRAALSLLRLDFYSAFLFNPMIFLVLPVTAFILIDHIILKRPIEKFIPFFIAVGVCLFIVYIIRMICLFPRIEPMTYNHASILGRIIFP